MNRRNLSSHQPADFLIYPFHPAVYPKKASTQPFYKGRGSALSSPGSLFSRHGFLFDHQERTMAARSPSVVLLSDCGLSLSFVAVFPWFWAKLPRWPAPKHPEKSSFRDWKNADFARSGAAS